MHQSNKHLGTMVHISNSTISNLNLGNVVGDLNSSIQQLSTEGRNDLAEALRKLTEVVGASEQMNDEVRKEVLEHLSIVSGEAAKPAGSRRMGPLKTSLEAVKSGVALGTQLLTLWQGAEHALKAAGVI
jgi:Mg-chelatase subunit ChlD